MTVSSSRPARDPSSRCSTSRPSDCARSAIVATAAFLRRGQVDDTFRLSEVLVDDPEPYVQKGVGWMLRHAGDVEPDRLRAFLEDHAATMPRDVLRAAVEKLPPAERKEWLAR